MKPQIVRRQVAGKVVPPVMVRSAVQLSGGGTTSSHRTHQAQFSHFIWHRNKFFLFQMKKKTLEVCPGMPDFFLQAVLWLQGAHSTNPILPHVAHDSFRVFLLSQTNFHQDCTAVSQLVTEFCYHHFAWISPYTEKVFSLCMRHKQEGFFLLVFYAETHVVPPRSVPELEQTSCSVCVQTELPHGDRFSNLCIGSRLIATCPIGSMLI